MATKDIIRRNGEPTGSLSPFTEEEFPTYNSLHREMTQWMQDWDSFLNEFVGPRWNLPRMTTPSLPQTARFSPPIDIRESGAEYTVTAELPGIDPKDVEITLQEGMLLIQGEKKYETESKGEGYHRVERSYGTFRRAISLPKGVDMEHIDASFHNGLLSLTIPKLPETKPQARKIEIKTGEQPAEKSAAK